MRLKVQRACDKGVGRGKESSPCVMYRVGWTMVGVLQPPGVDTVDGVLPVVNGGNCMEGMRVEYYDGTDVFTCIQVEACGARGWGCRRELCGLVG